MNVGAADAGRDKAGAIDETATFGRLLKTAGPNYKYGCTCDEIGELLNRYGPAAPVEALTLSRLILFDYRHSPAGVAVLCVRSDVTAAEFAGLMVELMISKRPLVTLVLAIWMAAGCSLFESDAVRAQKQYRRYVRQSIKNKQRQQRLIEKQQAAQPPPQPETAPRMEMSAGAGTSPEGATLPPAQ